MINNRGQYDAEVLLSSYENYFKALCGKYRSYIKDYAEVEDLFDQIKLEFIKLVGEYNPRRGVDFPGYIKLMLPHRVYHYVTRASNVQNKEACSDNIYDLYSSITDNTDFELIESRASIDDSNLSGKKRKKLLQDIMENHKTLEEIAEEEGVDVKVVRLRFHFLIKKLKEGEELRVCQIQIQRFPVIQRYPVVQRIPVI